MERRCSLLSSFCSIAFPPLLPRSRSPLFSLNIALSLWDEKELFFSFPFFSRSSPYSPIATERDVTLFFFPQQLSLALFLKRRNGRPSPFPGLMEWAKAPAFSFANRIGPLFPSFFSSFLCVAPEKLLTFIPFFPANSAERKRPPFLPFSPAERETELFFPPPLPLLRWSATGDFLPSPFSPPGAWRHRPFPLVLIWNLRPALFLQSDRAGPWFSSFFLPPPETEKQRSSSAFFARATRPPLPRSQDRRASPPPPPSFPD